MGALAMRDGGVDVGRDVAHGRDPRREVEQPVLLGPELQVRVHVPEAGDDRLPGGVDDRCAGRRAHGVGGSPDGAATIALDDDGRVDVSCFADEVVIDFPSVALAVDRIRRGFLVDEPSPRWHTAVYVSVTEARRGVTMPVEVPVRLTCHQCGGRGESWTEPCTRCDGSGTLVLHHVVQVTIPAGVLDGDRFHFTVVPRHHASTRIELQVRIEP